MYSTGFWLQILNQTQSRARYHVRELLKCLAHANSQSEEDRDIDEDSNTDVVRNDNFDNSEEGEQDDIEDDTEDDDLHCPLQVCEEKGEFEKLKDLIRHFAIRMMIYSVSLRDVQLRTCHRYPMQRILFIMRPCFRSSKYVSSSQLQEEQERPKIPRKPYPGGPAATKGAQRKRRERIKKS